MLTEVHLGPASQDGKASTASKKKEETYQVMGIEEEGNAKVNGVMGMR